ncbi:hypothetical protein V5735_09995 (plasmid) [Haladaptatus sp. SPP-AMP-3]|uniref:hypothetical protein n=1 Tax=Haladaptatus sp. SPP-AMP-3 TaxID=3121295 RepID=UPI003C2AC632
MDEDRIVWRLNLIIVLLCGITVFVAIPYLQFLLNRFPNFLFAVITALATMGGLVLLRTYRTVRS